MVHALGQQDAAAERSVRVHLHRFSIHHELVARTRAAGKTQCVRLQCLALRRQVEAQLGDRIHHDHRLALGVTIRDIDRDRCRVGEALRILGDQRERVRSNVQRDLDGEDAILADDGGLAVHRELRTRVRDALELGEGHRCRARGGFHTRDRGGGLDQRRGGRRADLIRGLTERQADLATRGDDVELRQADLRDRPAALAIHERDLERLVTEVRHGGVEAAKRVDRDRECTERDRGIVRLTGRQLDDFIRRLDRHHDAVELEVGLADGADHVERALGLARRDPQTLDSTATDRDGVTRERDAEAHIRHQTRSDVDHLRDAVRGHRARARRRHVHLDHARTGFQVRHVEQALRIRDDDRSVIHHDAGIRQPGFVGGLLAIAILVLEHTAEQHRAREQLVLLDDDRGRDRLGHDTGRTTTHRGHLRRVAARRRTCSRDQLPPELDITGLTRTRHAVAILVDERRELRDRQRLRAARLISLDRTIHHHRALERREALRQDVRERQGVNRLVRTIADAQAVAHRLALLDTAAVRGQFHGDGRPVLIIDVDHRHVGRVEARVERIRAGRRAGHDRVGDVAVHDRIVHTRDRDDVRLIPIGGRERQARGRDRSFGGVARRHRDHDVRHRLAAERDAERGATTRLARAEARDRRDRDARRIVVRVRHRDIRSVIACVGRIRAGGRADEDAVGRRAIDDRVVDSGHRDRLSGIPVRRREREVRG